MKRLGVIANCTKPRAADVLRKMHVLAESCGISLQGDVPSSQLVECLPGLPMTELLDTSEALVALGGDGTMLRLVRELEGRDIPVLGINIGGLGFMTSVAEGELTDAFSCLARGDYHVGERSMVECEVVHADGSRCSYRALNDVVVSRGPSSRVVVLDVCVDERPLTSYVCDGLIVATPTGSTGHSLSSGGPILMPTTSAFVLSLICPHTLSSRPLVVPGESLITVSTSSAESVLLSIDGQIDESLTTGESIRIKLADSGVRFIHLPGYDYLSVLRHKLRWRGSNVGEISDAKPLR